MKLALLSIAFIAAAAGALGAPSNALLGRLLGNLGFMSDSDEVRYGDVPEAGDDPYRYWRW